MTMTTQKTLSLDEIDTLTRSALSACGAGGIQLDAATRSVVDAEAEGIRAVGLNYLPIYLGHLRHGKLRGDAEPSHEQVAPSAIRADAANGFAHAAFVEAEADFHALASTQGVAALTIVNSYSAGVVGWFVDRMARAGLIGLGFANSPSAVSPAPGAGPFFGTNPMAFALPRPEGPPLVADMATSQVALVNIKARAVAGESIPTGWGYDAQGNDTTDATAVIDGGSLAPMGGYKGTLLALLVDALAGALAGPHCSFQAPMFKNNEGSYPAVGQCFLAISPGRLSPEAPDRFGSRLESMLEALAAEPGVRLPGSRRQGCREAAEREGIPVPVELIDRISEMAGA